jgi:hypothetical protein
MNPPKPNRRKPGANKLEPIDWHEFANDAVLNGNMSTLFHRPPTEDPSAYASPEALLEIEKRAARPAAPPILDLSPVPAETAAAAPPAGAELAEAMEDVPALLPESGSSPEGIGKNKKVKPLRNVHDALTLAGRTLYEAMYGALEGIGPRQCAKGYRQLAAETRLDKDTVRDLIADFKDKGMVREIGSYNPDTRSSKTYEVLSHDAILRKWRQAGLFFVTTGRQRPEFCSAQGEPHRYLQAHSGSQ